jgi:hypothetical protein
MISVEQKSEIYASKMSSMSSAKKGLRWYFSSKSVDEGAKFKKFPVETIKLKY